MARRTNAAKKTDEAAPLDSPATPPPTEAPVTAQEQPAAEQPERKLLPDPFQLLTKNVGGVQMHFQHSRQAGEFQIRFGDGSEKDKPSDEVRAFIKSHKIEVETRAGEKKEVQLFHWNKGDAAWGMRIDGDDPETSRQTAKRVYDETVKLVAQEQKAAPAQSAAAGLGA
jgi:hypothetical protein